MASRSCSISLLTSLQPLPLSTNRVAVLFCSNSWDCPVDLFRHATRVKEANNWEMYLIGSIHRFISPGPPLIVVMMSCDIV